jgi:hypothetical protein
MLKSTPEEAEPAVAAATGGAFFLAEFFGFDQADQVVAVGAGVEHCGFAGAAVPDQVAVDRHVLEGGVEHREATFKERGLGIPRFVGEGDQGIDAQTQVARDAADDQFVDLAALDGGELGQGDLGARGEVGVGDFHPTLGFVDDVVEIIFERDAGHRFETLRWRSERAS